MLNRNRTPTDGNTPPIGAAAKVRMAYFSVFHETNRQNRHLWIALFSVIGIAFFAVIAITVMQPLQKQVPYFLMEDPNAAGRVLQANLVAQQFDITTANKRYHIEDWVKWLWIIDGGGDITSTNLKRANILTAGAAIKELRDFVNQEKIFSRLADEPGLKREATVLDTSFIGDGVVIVRVALNERKNGELQKPLYKAMTIHYVLVPPQTKAEADRSPIGLTITDFSWSEARGKGD